MSRRLIAKTYLSWPHSLASVLRVDHFAELEKAGGANPWIMNQCDSDHTYRWVDVARFLAK